MVQQITKQVINLKYKNVQVRFIIICLMNRVKFQLPTYYIDYYLELHQMISRKVFIRFPRNPY